MKIITILSLSFSAILASTSLDNNLCKKCHAKIYDEYQTSMHKNASIYNDPVHKAIWDKHPQKKKDNYKCASCHSPADKALKDNGFKLEKNSIQTENPISCQSCHQIQSIQEHEKANKNIYTKELKTLFGAKQNKKGTKLIYHDESSFFGLFKKRVGSPYHNIDYTNENFYNSNVCMGCHSHKQNGKGFVICDLEVKKSKESKDSCISCHMPKVAGSSVKLKNEKTHSFHGVTALTYDVSKLSKYVKLSMTPDKDKFSIFIKNEATHTLTPQPLRLSMLKIKIIRDNKVIKELSKTFKRVIGTDGKPSMPWLATEIIEDNLIKALETREVVFDQELKKGDEIEAVFGYYIVNPKIAKKLGLEDEKSTKFITLKKSNFKN